MPLEYKVITAINLEDLESDVNTHIEDGWKPLGGISISLSESPEFQYFVAAQAMVHEST